MYKVLFTVNCNFIEKQAGEQRFIKIELVTTVESQVRLNGTEKQS